MKKLYLSALIKKFKAMSKYKVKASPKKEALSAQDIQEEKKFFKVAIIVTLVVIVLVYLAFNYL